MNYQVNITVVDTRTNTNVIALGAGVPDLLHASELLNGLSIALNVKALDTKYDELVKEEKEGVPELSPTNTARLKNIKRITNSNNPSS